MLPRARDSTSLSLSFHICKMELIASPPRGLPSGSKCMHRCSAHSGRSVETHRREGGQGEQEGERRGRAQTPEVTGPASAARLQAELHAESPGRHVRGLRPLPLLPAPAGAAGGRPAALCGGAGGRRLPAAPRVRAHPAAGRCSRPPGGPASFCPDAVDSRGKALFLAKPVVGSAPALKGRRVRGGPARLYSTRFPGGQFRPRGS